MPKYSCFIQFSSEWSSSLPFICIITPKASRKFSQRKDSIYPQQLFVCFVFWSCYINIKFYLLSPSLKNKNLLSVKVLDNRFSRFDTLLDIQTERNPYRFAIMFNTKGITIIWIGQRNINYVVWNFSTCFNP